MRNTLIIFKSNKFFSPNDEYIDCMKDQQKIKESQKRQPEQWISFERSAFLLIWVGVTIIILTTLSYSVPSLKNFFSERFGDYGELIGGIVGSLWSLAGVILFYEALRFQRTELKMQRHELELQRHEIIEQTEQQRLQNITLAYQAFENTFFQLMTLHNEIVESLNMEINEPGLFNEDGTPKTKVIVGRECFVQYYNLFKRYFHFSIEEIRLQDLDIEMTKELLDNSYVLFFEESQANLGHYFRNLFAIIKYIDTTNPKDKLFHIELIRAQLSNYELLLMYFHCLSKLGKKYKELMEKYAFFQNLPHDELVQMSKELYDKKAFELI